jgi:TonB family protein
MNHFFIYLLQSGTCMGILYGVYWIFLRKDTFHMVNRFYLILGAILSVVIPLLKIDLQSLGPVRSVMIYLDPIIITPDKIANVPTSTLDWTVIASIVYLTGVVLFFTRFVFQLVQLFLLTRRYGISRTDGMNIVFTDRDYSPFSFFNIIFLHSPERAEELRTILEHEQVHIRQKHSMDLLIIELVTILQWFNPFVWFTGRSLKTIHEFLADQGVLKNGFNKIDYQQLLLHRTMGIQVNNLTNNFNVSLIKKRIVMMKKSSSTAIARLKLAIALPALMALLVIFSGSSFNRVLAQTTKQEPQKETGKKSEKVYKEVEKQPQYPGGDAARVDFLVKNIKYPKEAKKLGIEGKVFVSFVIQNTGAVTDVEVTKGIGGGCDEEAARVIKMMPNWKPGESKGKPVAVKVILPIKFGFDKKDQKKPEMK